MNIDNYYYVYIINKLQTTQICKYISNHKSRNDQFLENSKLFRMFHKCKLITADEMLIYFKEHPVSIVKREPAPCALVRNGKPILISILSS